MNAYYRTSIEDEEITTIDLDEWYIIAQTASDTDNIEAFVHRETGRLLLLVSYQNGETYGAQGRDFATVEDWVVLGPYFFPGEVRLLSTMDVGCLPETEAQLDKSYEAAMREIHDTRE